MQGIDNHFIPTFELKAIVVRRLFTGVYVYTFGTRDSRRCPPFASSKLFQPASRSRPLSAFVFILCSTNPTLSTERGPPPPPPRRKQSYLLTYLLTCRRCQSTAEHSPPISVATHLCLSSFSSMSFLPCPVYRLSIFSLAFPCFFYLLSVAILYIFLSICCHAFCLRALPISIFVCRCVSGRLRNLSVFLCHGVVFCLLFYL